MAPTTPNCTVANHSVIMTTTSILVGDYSMFTSDDTSWHDDDERDDDLVNTDTINTDSGLRSGHSYDGSAMTTIDMDHDHHLEATLSESRHQRPSRQRIQKLLSFSFSRHNKQQREEDPAKSQGDDVGIMTEHQHDSRMQQGRRIQTVPLDTSTKQQQQPKKRLFRSFRNSGSSRRIPKKFHHDRHYHPLVSLVLGNV
jgi:hypothetical protein